MPTKKILPLTATFFFVGFILAYVLFSSFPGYVLPASEGEYTLVTRQPNEAFLTRLLFSLFLGLAFVSAPVASWCAGRYSHQATLAIAVAIYFAVMIGSIVLLVFYYKSHFAEMFSALGIHSTIPIPLDTIPYYRIPLLATLVTCFAGLLHRILRRRKNY
jgi:MFS family permease